MLLSRRELLDLALRAAAAPGAAAFFAPWLRAETAQEGRGLSAPPEPPLLRDYRPAFFDRGDFDALGALTEILIPTDETPGAREARCAHYIDFVLKASVEAAPDVVRQWRDALGALRAAGFHEADAAGRAALVEAMSRPERDPAAAHPAFGAYRLVKQMTAFAFYTSRAGTIEALDYRGNSYYAEFPACDHPEHRTP